MFDFNTAQIIEAGIALQTAALEWDADKTPTQAEARQAIIGMREALNVAQHHMAVMQRITENRRHGK